MDSPEFTEWIAFYVLEHEMNDTDREPTPDELMGKVRAFVAANNARHEARGKVTRERK